MRLMRSKTLCTLVLLIATPQFSLAAAPKAEKKRSPLLTDIALQKGGVLVGRLTDKEGNLRDKQKIILRLDQEVVAEVTTGKNGQFQVKGLQGGIYEVASEHGAGSFRAWADDTAPPFRKAVRRPHRKRRCGSRTIRPDAGSESVPAHTFESRSMGGNRGRCRRSHSRYHRAGAG